MSLENKIFLGIVAILLIFGLIMALSSASRPKNPLGDRQSDKTVLLNGSLAMIERNSLICLASTLSPRETVLWEAAQKYGYSYDILYSLWFCEAGLRHEDVWGQEGEYGAFQWKLRSFRSYSKKYGLELNIFDFKDQATLTAIVLKEPNGWKNWAKCFLKIR